MRLFSKSYNIPLIQFVSLTLEGDNSEWCNEYIPITKLKMKISYFFQNYCFYATSLLQFSAKCQIM